MTDNIMEIKDSECGKLEPEEVAELEGQCIIRLPLRVAASLRASLESGALNLQSRLKIKFEEDWKHCKILYDGWSLTGRVMDSPTILECLKTLDRKVFYKVADISQILICEDDDVIKNVKETYAICEKDKTYLLTQGVTPPLKNARHRFRKTLKKRNPDLPNYDREVKRLFRQDMEAASVRYELVSADEDKKQIYEMNGFSTENSAEDAAHVLNETELFGEVSCSEESGDEEEEHDFSLIEELEKHGGDLDASDAKDCCAVLVETPDDFEAESETAGENLDQLLKEQIMEDQKRALHEKVEELENQISSRQKKQRELECEILSIENDALRERFQFNIETLRQEINERQAEHNDIKVVLQEK